MIKRSQGITTYSNKKSMELTGEKPKNPICFHEFKDKSKDSIGFEEKSMESQGVSARQMINVGQAVCAAERLYLLLD